MTGHAEQPTGLLEHIIRVPPGSKKADTRMGICFQRVKKVVIPSQCSHWRGNLPDKRNIFDSENVDFPNN